MYCIHVAVILSYCLVFIYSTKPLDNDESDNYKEVETKEDNRKTDEPKTNEINNAKYNTLSLPTTNFSLEFLKQQKPNENVFFSPASIISLLGILFAGSAKNTKKQIHDAVFKDLTDDQVYNMVKNFTNSVQSLKAEQGIIFKTANKIYCDNHEQINSKFLDVMNDYFRSQVEITNFQSKAEESRRKINQWVSDQTNHKINELFKSGTISPETSVVLANAVYFKGIWTDKFDSKNNTQAPFYASSDKSSSVEMMVQTSSNFFFHESETVKLLGLPYGTNQQYIMFFILPRKQFGLNDLLTKELSDKKLLELLNSASNGVYKITVSLPKFKVEKPYDLSTVFSAMKMTDMFTQGVADFSNVDNKKDKFISAAVHKAFIDINEEGTEAGAGSGATLEWRIAPRKLTFNINHPFLFLIFDTQTANILFFGRVSNMENLL